MKNWPVKKIIIAVIVLIAATLLYKKFISSPKKSSDERIYTVIKGDLSQQVTIAGNVIPKRKTLISAPYDGYIQKIFVQVDQRVKQGDPIVSLSQSIQNTDNNFPLRSPIQGTVVHVKKSEGEYVRQSSTDEYILRIDDLSQLFMEADTPEVDRTKLKKGQEVLLKASAVSQKIYKGILQEVAVAAKAQDRWSNSQVQYPVRVKILDADDQLKPGMSAIGDIVTDKKENVLLVPHEYLFKENDKYFVLPIKGDKKEIKVGTNNSEYFEVTEGLNENDQLSPIDYTTLDIDPANSRRSGRGSRRR